VDPIIAHSRVVQLLGELGFTGWRTYPVTVTDREDHPHPNYHGLVITGRCGRIDLSRSAVVLHKYPARWYPHFLGHFFPEDSWDGSDLFMELPYADGEASGTKFATERVKQAFHRAKIKNVAFERLSERSVDASIYKIGSNHLLPPDYSDRVDEAYRRAGVERPGEG
jgi:hypothetical protein